MRAKDLKRFIGKRVVIEWTDEADWQWFFFIGIEGNNVWLRGHDSPGGIHHQGDVFSESVKLIKSIKLYRKSK